MLRPLPLAACLIAGCVAGASPTRAAEAATHYASWRGCLDRTFGIQAALTSRTLAAETALRSCRPAEMAYLTALSASPLLDAGDVTQVRPALLVQARRWLLARQTAL